MADRKTVLLVDDDPDFTLANRIAIEAEGLDVVVADCAREGIERAREIRPDLVVVDLMMEELHSGFQLVQELAASSETRDIPIVMVSAVTTETGFRVDDSGDAPSWLRVKAFLNKPIDPVDLAQRVREALGA